VEAWKEYREVLSESRSGISLSEKEILHLDDVISPLLKKKQSLHHICVHHSDSIMVSESTLYRFVDYNLFSARNIDMPRKVRYSKRRKNACWPIFGIPMTHNRLLISLKIFIWN
jgi:IS30 family transposase